MVPDQGVEVDPKNIDLVKNWMRPLTTKDIRSLLGFANFYRRFVEDFSAIAALLIALTKKKAMFEWYETSEKIFDELKYRLTSSLVHTLSRSGEKYVVYW